MIEGHGDDLHRYAGRVRYNFSSNILQTVDHTGLMSMLASRPELISGYPEPAPLSLERRLDSELGLPYGSTMVTAGATDAIYMIAGSCAGKTFHVCEPTFREYGDACTLHGLSEDGFDCADVVWLCNPNNPDGKVWDRSFLEEITFRRSGTLFVIDQSYSDYATDDLVTPDYAVRAGNILLLSSLTKRFSVPGLRIGYVIGSPSLTERLMRRRMPWSVSGIAIESAMYLLDHKDEYPIDSVGLHSEVCRIARGFSEAGIKVCDTKCNFLLAELPRRSASELKEWLVDRHGILIRDASNFKGLTPRHFRVAAQTPCENDLLIEAVRIWMSL